MEIRPKGPLLCGGGFRFLWSLLHWMEAGANGAVAQVLSVASMRHGVRLLHKVTRSTEPLFMPRTSAGGFMHKAPVSL